MQFPQYIIDRVEARQGCLHPYATLDASRTAFVIIDLQNYYTQPGYQGECVQARATFPAVNRLSEALRKAGGHVIWVKTNADGADEFWSHHHSYMLTPERSARRLRELGSNSDGFKMAEGLHVEDTDDIVTKRCYSALAPGSSNLDEVLKARGVSHVLIGGTVTNVCCESTARDAMMMNYATIMVDDTLSAFTPAEHEQSLHNWMLFFGDVLDSEAVISRLSSPVAG